MLRRETAAVSWAHSADGETHSRTVGLTGPAQETGSSTAGLRSGPPEPAINKESPSTEANGLPITDESNKQTTSAL